jgi:hypothetical protein
VRRTAPAQVMSLCLRRAEREDAARRARYGAAGSVRDSMHLRGLLNVRLGLPKRHFVAAFSLGLTSAFLVL